MGARDRGRHLFGACFEAITAQPLKVIHNSAVGDIALGCTLYQWQLIEIFAPLRADAVGIQQELLKEFFDVSHVGTGQMRAGLHTIVKILSHEAMSEQRVQNTTRF